MHDESVVKRYLQLVTEVHDDARWMEILGVGPEELAEIRIGVQQWRTDFAHAFESNYIETAPIDLVTTLSDRLDALAEPDWIMVERHEDAMAIADARTHGDFGVSYSDIVAHSFPASVAASVEAIQAFPGVSDAHHEDRESIIGWGTDVNLALLDEHLRSWWTDRWLGSVG